MGSGARWRGKRRDSDRKECHHTPHKGEGGMAKRTTITLNIFMRSIREKVERSEMSGREKKWE